VIVVVCSSVFKNGSFPLDYDRILAW